MERFGPTRKGSDYRHSVKTLLLTGLIFGTVCLTRSVDADTINTFKSRLDEHWLDQDVVSNFYAELTVTGGASISM